MGSEVRSLEAELAAEGALDPARAVRLLSALCQAHRAEFAANARLRIEPATVLISRTGAEEAARLSAQGLKAGAAHGSTQRDSVATLVRALGHLLYTMLVGGPLVVRYGVVEAPSAVSSRYMLSSDLDRVVLQALGYGSAEPPHATVEAFVKALQATPEARTSSPPAQALRAQPAQRMEQPARPSYAPNLTPVMTAAASLPSAPACPHCGKPNVPGVHYCAGCGLDLLRLPGAEFSPGTTRADALMRMSSSTPPPSPTATLMDLASSVPPAAVTEAPPKLPSAAPSTVDGQIVLTMFPPSGRVLARLALDMARQVMVGIDSDPALRADPEIEPRHAIFTRRGNQLFVRDAGTERGVYWKLKPNEPWLLATGQTFRIGNEVVRYDDALAGETGARRAQPFIGHLSVIEGINAGEALALSQSGVLCGRENGELRFPKDPFVSNRHCKIHGAGNGLVYLTDVGSTNGTFVRLSDEHPLRPGDVLRLGMHFFRVDF
jgi:pSer/pThr/pTyr-binding forkhead associated (FHA) protein